MFSDILPVYRIKIKQWPSSWASEDITRASES